MAYNLFVNDVDTKGKLQSSVAPSSGNDLANKTYVDESIAAGGGDWLASVKEQLSAPPGSPSSGDRYLVGSSGSGAWSGKDDKIAEYNGSSWDFTDPNEGMHVFIEGGSGDLGGDIVAVYSGSEWVKGASLNGALVASQNLNDLPNKGTARTNLGLGTLAVSSSVNLATQVSSQLSISNGGTGAASATAGFDALSPMTTAADIIVGGSSGTGERLAVGTAGQVLTVSSGATGLEWGSAGGSGTVTSVALKADDSSSTSAVTGSGDIEVDGGAAVIGGTNPIQTSISGGALVVSPRIATDSATGVASFTAANFTVNGGGGVSIKSGGVDLTDEVAGTLPVANGGTGLTSISTLLNSNVTPTSLGLVIGTNVQAHDAQLDDIAALTPTDSSFIVGDGSNWVAESGSTVRTSLGLGSIATQASNSVTVTGGSISGVTGSCVAPIGVKAQAYSSAQSLTPSFAAGPEVMMIDLAGESSTSTVTLPIPTASDIGKSFEVKVMGGMSSTNALTVSVASTGKMDNETSIVLDQDYQRLKFTAFGTSTGGVNYALG